MDPERLGAEPSFDEAEVGLERMSRALPKLAETRYACGWAGAFDITPDCGRIDQSKSQPW